MFANSAITIYNINYVLFKDKKNNDGEAIWPNSSRTRISTQGYKTALLTRPLCQPVQTDVIPPFSPQAHLTFHQPTLHPRTLHHLQYTAPQLPHPLPIFTPSIVKTCKVSTPSPSNPFEKPQLTALPCPALPSLSHAVLTSAPLVHRHTHPS